MPTEYTNGGRRWPSKPRSYRIDTSPPVVRSEPNEYGPFESYPNTLNDRPIKRCLKCRNVMYYDEYCHCLERAMHAKVDKKRKSQRPSGEGAGDDSVSTSDSDNRWLADAGGQLRIGDM